MFASRLLLVEGDRNAEDINLTLRGFLQKRNWLVIVWLEMEFKLLSTILSEGVAAAPKDLEERDLEAHIEKSYRDNLARS